MTSQKLLNPTLKHCTNFLPVPYKNFHLLDRMPLPFPNHKKKKNGKGDRYIQNKIILLFHYEP